LEDRSRRNRTSENPYVTRRLELIHTQCITSPTVRSVVFLPENRILLGATHTKDLARHAALGGVADGPILAVYNLDQVPVPALGSKRLKPAPAVIFFLELGRDLISADMFLHHRLYDHSSPEAAVPFFGSPADQLLVVT